MTLREIIKAVGDLLGRIVHWVYGVITFAVVSAEHDIDKGEIKKIVQALGLAAGAAGSLQAGFRSVAHDPEVVWSLTMTAFLLLGAFLKGVSVYHQKPHAEATTEASPPTPPSNTTAEAPATPTEPRP